MTSFGIYLFETLGTGLLAANKVSCFEGLVIMECVPLGSTSLLMVQGSLDKIRDLSKELAALKPNRSTVIEKLNPKVLDAYQSLSNSEVGESLYVIESDFIGDIFQAANVLFEANLQCVDLRMPRSSNRSCYLLMTGGGEFDVLNSIKNISVQTTKIERTSSSLKSYFNFPVEA